VPIVILALVLGPSLVVFLVGCFLVAYRTLQIDRHRVARLHQRDRAI
jgi:hypothetical protein